MRWLNEEYIKNKKSKIDNSNISTDILSNSRYTEEVSEVNNDIMDRSSSTIFSRNSLIDAKLEDFSSHRLLGEGSYGKVFLVENKKN